MIIYKLTPVEESTKDETTDHLYFRCFHQTYPDTQVGLIIAKKKKKVLTISKF